MAPPRKGAASVVDDSRSEASSGTRELKGTSSKSRKGVNASGLRSATITPNMAGVPVVQAAEQTQEPKVRCLVDRMDFSAKETKSFDTNKS